MALGLDHPAIEDLHLLKALLQQDGGGARPLLSKVGIAPGGLNKDLDAALKALPKLANSTGEISVGQELGKILNISDKLAQQRNDQFIASELVLLAASQSQTQAGELLRKHGATPEAISTAIDQIRGGDAVTDPNAEDQQQALQKYTIDLTARAEAGKLDPVIGRDEEIRRVIQVLSRRTKNNPALMVSQVWAKRPSPRAWLNALSMARFRKGCATALVVARSRGLDRGSQVSRRV